MTSMHRIKARNRRPAFTLIELLVVISIIALLIAILLPALSRTRESANRSVCLSNTRQLTYAMNLYAQEDPDGVYLNTVNSGSDNLNVLIGSFIGDPEVAICPSTENVIRPDQTSIDAEGKTVYTDLNATASGGAADSGGGHSYEVWGWFNVAVYPDGTRIEAEYRKTIDNVITPSNKFIALDGDDTGTFGNWPDETNNHGKEGLNIGFLDGHSKWVSGDEQLVKTYLSGWMNPIVPGALMAYFHPGLQVSTNAGLTKYDY